MYEIIKLCSPLAWEVFSPSLPPLTYLLTERRYAVIHAWDVWKVALFFFFTFCLSQQLYHIKEVKTGIANSFHYCTSSIFCFISVINLKLWRAYTRLKGLPLRSWNNNEVPVLGTQSLLGERQLSFCSVLLAHFAVSININVEVHSFLSFFPINI